MKYKRGWKIAAGLLVAVLLLAVGMTVGASAYGDGCGTDPCLAAGGTAEIRFRIPGILFPNVCDEACDPALPSDAERKPTETSGSVKFFVRIIMLSYLLLPVIFQAFQSHSESARSFAVEMNATHFSKSFQKKQAQKSQRLTPPAITPKL